MLKESKREEELNYKEEDTMTRFVIEGLVHLEVLVCMIPFRGVTARRALRDSGIMKSPSLASGSGLNCIHCCS